VANLLRKKQAGTEFEILSSKGASGGYCGLTGTKVPIANLPTGTTVNDVAIGNDARFTDPSHLAGLDSPSRTFHTRCIRVATSFLTISGTAYFVYIGRTPIAMTLKYVESYLNVVGATLTLAEAGFFSTPSAPNKAGQSLTKLVAVATWDSLLSGPGVKRSAVMATSIPAGTHLWAGGKFAFTTNPSFNGILYDLREGELLVTASAAAFSTAGPWTGALVAAQTASAMVPCCPDLSGVLD